MPSETQVFEMVSALVLTLIGAWIANKTGIDGSSVPTLDAKIVAMTAELQSMAAGLPGLVITSLADKVRVETNALIATKAASDDIKRATLELGEAIISAGQGLLERGVKDLTAELNDPLNFITGTPSKGGSSTSADTAMANIRLELDSVTPIEILPFVSFHKVAQHDVTLAAFTALSNRKVRLTYDYGSLVLLFVDWPAAVVPLYANFLSKRGDIVSQVGQVQVDLTALNSLKGTAWEDWGISPPPAFYSETVIDSKLAALIGTTGTDRYVILTTTKADVTTQEALFETARQLSADFKIVLPSTMKKAAGLPTGTFIPLVNVQPDGTIYSKSPTYVETKGKTGVAYYTIKVDP